MMFSEVMGQTKKAKVTFTCNPEVKEYLEEWAKSERRTISNLVEGVIEDVISQRKSKGNDTT